MSIANTLLSRIPSYALDISFSYIKAKGIRSSVSN